MLNRHMWLPVTVLDSLDTIVTFHHHTKKVLLDSAALDRWFSTGGDFGSQGHLVLSRDIFVSYQGMCTTGM